jgi:hypothetical protein
MQYVLRVEKIINMFLMRDFWDFSLFGWKDVSSNNSELGRFVSGSMAKHQVSSPVIILLKIFLSASAIMIMSWQDVTRSSLYSGVKECGTKHAHNFLFPKTSFIIRRTTVLWMFKNSTIILYAIRRSCFTKSATAALFTSVRVDFGRPLLVIFYQLPSFSNSRIPPKNFWSVHSFIPIRHLHQYWCFCRRQTGFERKCTTNFCLFPPSMTCKENWLYKTSSNSYTVER